MRKLKEFYENKYKKGKWAHPLHPSESIKLSMTKKMLRISKEDEVLELGCGSGRYLTRLVRECKKIVGVDISKTVIKIASSDTSKEKTKTLEFVLTDIIKIPFRDESLDKVYCIDVLEHIPDDFNVMRETYRLLREGGEVLLYVPCRNPLSLGWIISKLTNQYPWYPGDKEAGHVHRYTTKDIKKIIRKSGFNIIQVKYFDHFMSTLFELPLSYVKRKLFKGCNTNGGYESKFYLFLRMIEIVERIELSLLGNKTNAAGMFILCSKQKEKN